MSQAATQPAAPNKSTPRPGAYRLVAIDLDGTLLRSDKKLSARAAHAIQQASARGVKVVIASARPPRSSREVYQRLGLDTLQVCYNGALTIDWQSGRYLQHLALCNRLGADIVRNARMMDPGVVVWVERLDKWLTDRADPLLGTMTSETHAPDFVGPLDQCMGEPMTKLMLLAPPERMLPMREVMRAQYGHLASMFVTDAHLLQFCHPAVDKAAAVAWVAKQYGIAAEECVAIGDAPNDAGMLRWAGLGVAVANAWPQTLEAADATVAANDDDGVAEAIEKYVLT